MRILAPPPPPPPPAAAPHNLSHISQRIFEKEPQISSTTTPPCNLRTCRWKPYSNSNNDTEANAAVVIIVLFSALICALSLNAAIRCFLRGGGERAPPRLPQTQREVVEQPKPALEVAASPKLVYSTGMKLAGAEAECTICLSEFEEGESIQVLPICNHGFHVECIQKWLISHTSCPTCRTSIFSSSPIREETSNHWSTSDSQPQLPSTDP